MHSFIGSLYHFGCICTFTMESFLNYRFCAHLFLQVPLSHSRLLLFLVFILISGIFMLLCFSMCYFQGRSHFSSVILCFPHVVGASIVVFTPTCVTPLHIIKVNFGTHFYTIWSYISLEYVLDTFLHIGAPFGHSRYNFCNFCYKCCNVSFQMSHLEIGVSLLLF